ncbi:hypothetical protein [Halococcus agarilyticus]|uniref:hypothetical protein n=1 Tax=Halococcus agarilyticus TaxID=1232219 RepID=UPI0006776160|nr:hypothetical protein [Halococcus agarilyticus]
MKRARVVGLAFTVFGVAQTALTLASSGVGGEPLQLTLNVLLTSIGVVMAWQPERVDGKRSTGYLQEEAGTWWLLLGGGCVVLGIAGLALAVGSTVGA